MKKFESLITELRELRTKRPFCPFKVVTKDGKSYTVGRPLWFACNDKSMVVLPNGGYIKYLKFDEVDSLKPIKKRKS
jgi:hypothetical protein